MLQYSSPAFKAPGALMPSRGLVQVQTLVDLQLYIAETAETSF
jgi:hypothetical protein